MAVQRWRQHGGAKRRARSKALERSLPQSERASCDPRVTTLEQLKKETGRSAGRRGRSAQARTRAHVPTGGPPVSLPKNHRDPVLTKNPLSTSLYCLCCWFLLFVLLVPFVVVPPPFPLTLSS